MPPETMPPLFAPLTPASTLGPALVDLLTTAPADHWHPYFGFLVLPVPAPVLRTDPTLATLGTLHPFQGGICRLPPHCCYTWHMDTRRGAAVNLLVHHTHSHTLFTDAAAFAGAADVPVVPAVELVYAPNTYYLFHSQQPHMVLNGAGPRYLLSLEFAADQVTLPYAELHAELAAQGLVEVPP
jgi:hypothetical protein